MSVKSIDQFYTKLIKDKEMQEKFKELQRSYKGKLTPNKAIDFLENGLIPFAREYGFVFSLDDLIDYEAKTHIKNIRRQTLTDDDLKDISGGKFTVEQVQIAMSVTNLFMSLFSYNIKL